MGKTIVLASPRGFCAGVVRAIDIVNLALEAYGKPIYVLNDSPQPVRLMSRSKAFSL
jgi:4-hydroxy-3-methylbut-2-enyl diphosphate reductase